MTVRARLYDDFQELRPAGMAAPFWFWNDDLDPAEIRRQIQLMHDQNIGGFFMHARVGRVTPYMSPRWMECVRAAVDEAKKHGMLAWIYDEDNWPSGYAGGAICTLGDDYLQRYVVCNEVPVIKDGTSTTLPKMDGIVAVLSARKTDDGYTDIHRLPDTCVREGAIAASDVPGDTVLCLNLEIHRFRREFCPECVTDGYVDVMNPDVIGKFIEHTYEGYKKEVGDAFGTTVPGFFVDEPNYHERNWPDKEYRTPWTAKLPEVYRALNGRDLISDLPSLFFDTGDYLKIRHDYYRCITRLFVEAFSKQIGEWCGKNGVAMTGHYILEECLRAAVQTIGNAMEHYEYEQVPGIDHLGQYIDLEAFWSSSRVLCKQVDSVAHQFNRRQVMCETYAGGGWDFGPLEQKWMGDWMIALGVNLICPHAFHYSLRGYRKRDYPPSLGYQQPWFPMSADLGAHFARINWMVAQGERVVPVAMLHPMNSIRATHKPTQVRIYHDPYSKNFEAVTKALLDNQIDFDYLDEELLARHGGVNGDELTLGQGHYRVVIVPHMLTLRRESLELLKRFKAAGGKVLVIEPWPHLLDAEPSEEPDGLFKQCVRLGQWHSTETLVRMIDTLRRLEPPVLRLTCEAGSSSEVVYRHNRAEGMDVFFMASAKRGPHSVIVTLNVGDHRVAERWDTVTGEKQFLGESGSLGLIDFSLDFDFARSHLIVVRDRDEKDQEVLVDVDVLLREWSPETEVSYELDTPNAFIFDNPRLSFDGGEWSAPMPALDANAVLAEAITKGRKAGRVQYRFTTRIDIPAPLTLLSETPEAFTFYLDGVTVAAERIPPDPKPKTRNPGPDADWFADISLKKIPLSGGLAKGEHVLEIEFPCKTGVEIEPCYILGNFGVYRDSRGEACIDSLPSKLRLESWDTQGLLYYAGRVAYELSVELKPGLSGAPWLQVPRFSKALSVDVNGRDAGSLLWPPHEVPLAGLLKEGRNTIRVTAANSLRNFYGPHHLKAEETIDCLGPGEVRERRRHTPEIITKPAGVLSGVLLVERRMA